MSVPCVSGKCVAYVSVECVMCVRSYSDQVCAMLADCFPTKFTVYTVGTLALVHSFRILWVHACTHTYIHARMHAHTHSPLMYSHTRTYTHECTRTQPTDVNTYIRTCTHACTHTHTHTQSADVHIHTQPTDVHALCIHCIMYF